MDAKTSLPWYTTLSNKYKDYIEGFDMLYQLKALNEDEIKKVYDIIKTNLIDTMKCSPSDIINQIFQNIVIRNRYLKSYWTLFKMIYEEYHPKLTGPINSTLDCLLYKEYGFTINNEEYFEFTETDIANFCMKFFEKSIIKAIINDDIRAFIFCTEQEDYSKSICITTYLFPKINKGNGYKIGNSLLEICCYYGAANCFKFLRTKYNSKITPECLYFSFLSRNAEIMNECLKVQKPDDLCMGFAIISHNIDFITFLMNEYQIKFIPEFCTKYRNLGAFLAYLDQTSDIETCFIYSVPFGIRSLCEYFLSQNVNVNAKEQTKGMTALHLASINNMIEIAEMLISHGADINAKDLDGCTPLHLASKKNMFEMAEMLILNGADIESRDNHMFTPLHHSANNNSIEVFETLIFYGADINAVNEYMKTALMMSLLLNYDELSKIIISYGADVNLRDQFGQTAYFYALHKSKIEILLSLLSHGADKNVRDNFGKTAFEYMIDQIENQVYLDNNGNYWW
ncbi:ankyrin repeat protein, putative [Trichomonas vaginalis G3]|uniref:Ankyrin repeat protein, putative n=1 Tax=Trichomonas vaginalis (strain ATCC PRA-98 / G3) TaxID=412133 RepID=A2DIK8_TRIV3|nr:protein ubiquitination [Trichomonas vaginalis G3]EAY19812.1 ankyrin repeat protein, putative [Trichomonas vaginalis G3]KAI5524015.1 protein ubiquitination [Trichomonas vaginalis G3]|eukprot:XP_001580798.1 ankyrin repeat protein [Trichomonas vaginalis G3]